MEMFLFDEINHINRITKVVGKEACRDAHVDALPDDLKSKLTVRQRRKLDAFEALVLEWLPLRKRRKIEAAVRDRLLKIEQIVGSSKNLVSERRSPTILGWLLAVPAMKIEDFFPKK